MTYILAVDKWLLQPYRTLPLVLPGAKVKRDNAALTQSYLALQSNSLIWNSTPVPSPVAQQSTADALLKQKVSTVSMHPPDILIYWKTLFPSLDPALVKFNSIDLIKLLCMELDIFSWKRKWYVIKLMQRRWCRVVCMLTSSLIDTGAAKWVGFSSLVGWTNMNAVHTKDGQTFFRKQPNTLIRQKDGEASSR